MTTMLWQRTWIDTRARFLVGLVLVACTTVWVVGHYKTLMLIWPQLSNTPWSTEIEWQVGKGFHLTTFRGYVLTQIFMKNVLAIWCLFAAILGSGGLLSRPGHGGMTYLLSLPVPRTRLVMTRAYIVLAELFVLAIVPALLVPVASSMIGQPYDLVDAMVHGLSLFAAGIVFFAAAFFLSAVFNDVWRPLLGVLALVVVLNITAQRAPASAIFRLMSAVDYFRGDGIPLTGLLACMAASAMMITGAVFLVSRRDF